MPNVLNHVHLKTVNVSELKIDIAALNRYTRQELAKLSEINNQSAFLNTVPVVDRDLVVKVNAVEVVLAAMRGQETMLVAENIDPQPLLTINDHSGSWIYNGKLTDDVLQDSIKVDDNKGVTINTGNAPIMNFRGNNDGV